MSYSPLDHGEQMYHRNPRGHNNSQSDFELQSLAPSFASGKSGFISYSEAAQRNATSDYQHLVQPPYQGPTGIPWRPGFWRQLPILGVLSLLGVLISTVAALAILIQSNGKPLDHWGDGLAPSVYLAIASVIANALSAYSLATGLRITFWRDALQGRTLAELNQNWLGGHNLYHALVQGYRVGGRRTALACVLTVAALLRGPLNQRASSVRSEVAYGTSGNLQLSVAQYFPEGYTGYSMQSRAVVRKTSRLTPEFAQVMQEYSVRSNISMNHTDCGVTCTINVKGFGFKTECRYEETVQATAAGYTVNLFETSATLYPIGGLAQSGGYYENMGLRLNATYEVPLKDNDARDGTDNKLQTRLRSHICDSTGGIVLYKVQLAAQAVTLSANRSDDQVIKDLVMEGPGVSNPSTIGGFQFAAASLFTSTVVFNFGGAVSDAVFNGALAIQMVRGPDAWNLSNQDPMDTMLDAMREITFRTSVRAGGTIANVTDAKQEVQYHGSATHSVYITNHRYMTAAVVLSIASVLAIAQTFYGWWELGRTVSLSPLEIAKAFNAPLLAPVGSNFDLSDNKGLGPMAATRVQYGEKIDEHGYATQYAGGGMEPHGRRLVLGLAGEVKRPAAGQAYGN